MMLLVMALLRLRLRWMYILTEKAATTNSAIIEIDRTAFWNAL